MSDAQRNRRDPAPARDALPWWLGAAVPSGVVALAAAPLIAAGSMAGRGAFDQINYHEPMIRRFAESWPSLDFSDYLSATTPAYHVALAWVAHVWPGSAESAPGWAMRAVGLMFAVLAAGLLGGMVAKRAGAAVGASCGLLLGLGVYAFASAAWLLPDNAGWAAVLCVLAICLRERAGPGWLIAAGAGVVAVVVIRQSHLWTAGVVWAAGWLWAARWDGWGRARSGRSSGGRSEPWEDVLPLLSLWPRGLLGIGVGVAATVPALGVMGWFSALWDGFVPPIYQGYMQGGNAAVVPLVFLQLAIFGAFFLGFWVPALVDAWREADGGRRRALALAFAGAVVVGLVIAVVPATNWDKDAGRWSGYWNLTRVLPDLAGRTNAAFLVACPAGAVALLGLLRAADARSRWVLLGALVAATAALAANQNAWQRYTEPMLVIVVSLLAASAAGVRTGAWKLERAARVAGPAAMAALFAGLTAVTLARSPDAVLLDTHPRVPTPLRTLWPESWQASPPEAWAGWDREGAVSGTGDAEASPAGDPEP